MSRLALQGLAKTCSSRVSSQGILRRTMAKTSAISLTHKKRKGQKITMVTAYDYPSALAVSRAEMDIILVGDSVAMVELGHETTQPVTLSDMIHHCSAVKRGVETSGTKNAPLLVGDMPFGSYEYANVDIALENAYRLIKEAGMDAVKLEVSVDSCFFFVVCPFFLSLQNCCAIAYLQGRQPRPRSHCAQHCGRWGGRHGTRGPHTTSHFGDWRLSRARSNRHSSA